MNIVCKYLCPVCGYPDLPEAPYCELGNGSDEYCPCCGFQFGHSEWNEVEGEDDPDAHRKWREQWIKKGMPWNALRIKPPPDWSAVKQLTLANLLP